MDHRLLAELIVLASGLKMCGLKRIRPVKANLGLSAIYWRSQGPQPPDRLRYLTALLLALNEL